MPEHFSRSLVFRTGVALAAIVMLAIVSIIASVVVADRLEGDAEAINVAGSLRMQSYRIGLLINQPAPVLDAAVADFEERLASPVLAQTVRASGHQGLAEAWLALQSRWEHEMKPTLVTQPVEREVYLERVTDFVAAADHFVRRLQYASEDKIQTLRIVQGLTMFLTLTLVFAAMYGLNADVISPLYALVNAARATGRGDFTVRVEHVTDDELGVLGQAFNTMADDLSRIYGELGEHVQEKTTELQRNNDALNMLYRMSRLLAEPGNIQPRLPQVLGMIATTLRARPAFYGGNSGEDFRIITPDGEFPSAACVPGRFDPSARWGDPLDPRRVVVFPVATHQHVFGQLYVEAENDRLDPWAEQVLRSATETLAAAMSLAASEEDQRRILLMQERAVIARELHDSLAQSLSYLKIQVSRLDSLLARDADKAEITSIIDDLREGLNSAYRQLRELLTTFRLRIEGRGFGAAINTAVSEFSSRGIDIQLDFRISHCAIAANEEIHALQIVREALSNVVRHARATTARVSLRQRADGRVEIIVEDDGVGMSQQTDKRQHHGLVIMRERAATLGGRIEWAQATPHGTRVTLDFRPAYLNS